MGRAPLDLYAFFKDAKENSRKTELLEDRVTRDKSFQQGEIVFLQASGDVSEERNLGQGRIPDASGTAEYLNEQCSNIRKMYAPTFVLSTENCDPGTLAKQVARRALMGHTSPRICLGLCRDTRLRVTHRPRANRGA